jgi:hypothetical protein
MHTECVNSLIWKREVRYGVPLHYLTGRGPLTLERLIELYPHHFPHQPVSISEQQIEETQQQLRVLGEEFFTFVQRGGIAFTDFPSGFLVPSNELVFDAGLRQKVNRMKWMRTGWSEVSELVSKRGADFPLSCLGGRSKVVLVGENAAVGLRYSVSDNCRPEIQYATARANTVVQSFMQNPMRIWVENSFLRRKVSHLAVNAVVRSLMISASERFGSGLVQQQER